MNFLLALPLLIFLSLTLLTAPVSAINTEDTGFKVDNGTTKTVDVQSNCKRITNNHISGKAIFVPTKDPAEWTAFLGNLPAGVISSDCIGWEWTGGPEGWILTNTSILGGGRFGNPANAVVVDGWNNGYTTYTFGTALPSDTYTFNFDIGGAFSSGCGSTKSGARITLEVKDTSNVWTTILSECIATALGDPYEARTQGYTGSIKELKISGTKEICAPDGDIADNCEEWISMDNLMIR